MRKRVQKVRELVDKLGVVDLETEKDPGDMAKDVPVTRPKEKDQGDPGSLSPLSDEETT